MKPSESHRILPPMVTPGRDRDALDLRGLERLIEHRIKGAPALAGICNDLLVSPV
jgi:dihydrodipicolinate synthase/N-acetylneuraminate lyase